MIKKMTKYSIILLNRELYDFLHKLQELGIVDITRSVRAIDKHSKSEMDNIAEYNTAIKKLKSIPNATPNDLGLLENGDNSSYRVLLDFINDSFYKKDTQEINLRLLQRAYLKSALWGDYNTEDISRLNKLGYSLHFFICSESKYKNEWENDYAITILNQENGKIYFCILVPKEEQDNFKFFIRETTLPETPASVLASQIDDLKKDITTNLSNLNSLPFYIDILTQRANQLSEELDIYLANAATKKEGDDSIAILEGFAEIENRENIIQFLESSNVVYLVGEAEAEDNPPVKLKNNIFSRPFETISNLYMLPRYDELDLTPYFAPFYMLFFGICLGDIGYGLVLTFTAIIGLITLPKFRDYCLLILWLGIGTIIMPALTGGFFGAKIYEIIPAFEVFKDSFLTDMQFFWFGIIFGIVHIIYARFINVVFSISRKRWDKALSNLGWIMLIIVLSFMYAASESPSVALPKLLNDILLYGGLVLVLFCSSPSKYFFLRPIKGIMSLYDITGVFGDVLSYIRLFGLGTSGAILGLVVNSVAMQLSSVPYLGWGLTIIMLVIGHLAVLALSSLGAIVHPMRLTFVEFYKNVEFEGGGRAFNPLKTKNNN